MTAAKLKELEAKATEGTWAVVDCRPVVARLFLTDGAVIVCRIENSISGEPLEAEDEANAELIAYLRNHTQDFIKLLEAAERTCIASSHGIAPISDLREALAAFKEKL